MRKSRCREARIVGILKERGRGGACVGSAAVGPVVGRDLRT